MTARLRVPLVKVLAMLLLALLMTAATDREARAVLGGFETADGYATPFPKDVWSYDAGQTGANFAPAQYNTGRWQELFGSGNAGGDAQYISQHGVGSGGANAAPFALAVRSISPSTDGSFDMAVRYALGVDDLGVSPMSPLQLAKIEFDICRGLTVLSTGGLDTVFNDAPAFSLSMGGTNAAPGLTIGFTDHNPANTNQPRIFHMDGSTYNSQVVPWSGNAFDHIQVDIDFVNQTYDFWWTKDANLATNAFDAGNAPQLIASGASFTSPMSILDSLFFRAHTDLSNGQQIAGLEKSFLDNFRVSVVAVPEPASGAILLIGAVGLALVVRRRGLRVCD